jgi:adenylate kinase family enzyme
MLELTTKKSQSKKASGRSSNEPTVTGSSSGGKNRSEKMTSRTDTTTTVTPPIHQTVQPWTEKYCPQTLAEMKLHHTKVKALESWLNKRVLQYQYNGVPVPSQSSRPSILILIGNSGAGKSTAIDLLCQEHGVEVVNWTDAMWDSKASTLSGTYAETRIDTHNSSSGTAVRSDRAVVADFLTHSNSNRSTHDHSSGTAIALNHGLIEDLFSLSHSHQKIKQLDDWSLQCKYPSLSLTSKDSLTSKQREQALTVSQSSKASSSLLSLGYPSIRAPQNKILLVHDPFSLQFLGGSGGDANKTERVPNRSETSSLSEAVCERLLSCGLPVVLIVSDAIEREDQNSHRYSIVPHSLTAR